MASVFSMPISHLREWSRRQAPDHRQMNEPVDAINRMVTGVGVPRQAMARVGASAPAEAATSAVAQFKLKQNADTFPDHLICRAWDGETLGSEDVLVAKPWDIRRTSFDGRGDSVVELYTYTTPTHRIARIRLTDIVEEQIIIRRYEINDILYATENIKGGTEVIHEDTPIVWLDDNRAARAFAAVFQE